MISDGGNAVNSIYQDSIYFNVSKLTYGATENTTCPHTQSLLLIALPFVNKKPLRLLQYVTIG